MGIVCAQRAEKNYNNVYKNTLINAREQKKMLTLNTELEDILELLESRMAVNSALRRAAHLLGRYHARFDEIQLDTDRLNVLDIVLKATGGGNDAARMEDEILKLEEALGPLLASWD